MSETVIKRVKLNNFRSHENYSLDCSRKTTLILGENGCGKTSVLEAIYIAMRGKSFRAVDKEIIRRETEFYRIELEYKNGEKVVVTYENGEVEDIMGISGGVTNIGVRKTFLVKGKKTARLPKLSKYPVILFLPEDLHLVATSPTRRREYFDRILGQLDEKYSSSLSRYNKILKQRNELLKQDYVQAGILDSWNVLLARYGVYIRKRRAWLMDELSKYITETYRSIAENEDECGIVYKNYTGSGLEDEYVKLLVMDYERDKVTGHTNFGVHKDDFEFMFNGVLADGSASRGETRSIILALKFIEARILGEVLGKKPVVLLDDVFSELDKTRQKSLVNNFRDYQVILTSVEGVEIEKSN